MYAQSCHNVYKEIDYNPHHMVSDYLIIFINNSGVDAGIVREN